MLARPWTYLLKRLPVLYWPIYYQLHETRFPLNVHPLAISSPHCPVTLRSRRQIQTVFFHCLSNIRGVSAGTSFLIVPIPWVVKMSRQGLCGECPVMKNPACVSACKQPRNLHCKALSLSTRWRFNLQLLLLWLWTVPIIGYQYHCNIKLME